MEHEVQAQVLDGAVRDRLLKLHEEIAKEKGFRLDAQEVMPDHAHLIMAEHPKYPPASIVKIFKGITAKVFFEEFLDSGKPCMAAICGTRRTTMAPWVT